MLASEMTLGELVGRRVRATQAFNGIPEGTQGLVTKQYDDGGGLRGVMVKWTTTPGTVVEDGFGRDVGDLDETQWLEIVGPDDLYECGDSCCNMAVCICGDCPGCSGGIE